MNRFAKDSALIASLVFRLRVRGTRSSRSALARRMGWTLPRDWRAVAARYLRRHAGGSWHVGGHHVGRFHYGPGICARPALRGELSQLRDDGRRAVPYASAIERQPLTAALS